MNSHDKFALCAALAAKIVAAYRTAAPEGCDPQNSFVTVAAVATVGTAASGAYSATQSANAQEDAQQQQIQEQATLDKNQQKQLKELAGRLDMGTKPIAAEYKPIDFTQEQLASILGNSSNFDEIRALVSKTNRATTRDDRLRAERLIPGFTNILKSEADAAGSLLNGQLPFDDVLGIVSDRSSLAGSLGTPGASGTATLKDLGLSRLDAIKTGGGIFKDMVGIAQSVSPVERYARPMDFFTSPERRIENSMQQNQLIQQSDQSRNNLAAAPDPTKVARQQLELAAILGQSGPLYAQPVAQPDYSKYLMQAVGGLRAGYNSGAFGGPGSGTPSYSIPV